MARIIYVVPVDAHLVGAFLIVLRLLPFPSPQRPNLNHPQCPNHLLNLPTVMGHHLLYFSLSLSLGWSQTHACLFSPQQQNDAKLRTTEASCKMGMQLRISYCLNHFTISPLLPSPVHKHTRCSTISQLSFKNQIGYDNSERAQFFVAASNNADSPFIGWDEWKPEKRSKAPSLSDVLWPSAGAFAAMAMLGKMDQVLAPRGVSMTIAPFGAVCAVLFATPSSPAARKYNMFLAQIGCAVIGVLAFLIFGPGWLARSTGLAAAIAFMIYTRAIHPPAASLPLLFVDGAKLHGLNFWFAFFPGAAGCIVLWLIQEIVCFLKDNFKF